MTCRASTKARSSFALSVLLLTFFALNATFLMTTAALGPAHALATFVNVEGGPPLRRGVGVHNVLNSANVNVAGTAYTWPPFSGPEHELPKDIIRQVKDAGFDFVRLTVDPGPFLYFAGSRRAQLDEILADTIRRFRVAGLDVLVDFHANDQLAAYTSSAIVADENSPLFAKYLALIGRTAQLLSTFNQQNVALEVMNEPPSGYGSATQQAWQRMVQAMHAAVRQAAPDLLVVLSGGQSGSIDGLLILDPMPFSGSKVRFSFHYYDPKNFTHQGVHEDINPANVRIWGYLSGIGYPADQNGFTAMQTAFQARVAADMTLSRADRRLVLDTGSSALPAYFNGLAARIRIPQNFDRVVAWCSRYGINPGKVFVGEFGTTRQGSDLNVDGARSVSRSRWLSDIVAAAGSRAFTWSIWELYGYGGMAIVSDGKTIDRGTLMAIGLGGRSVETSAKEATTAQ